LDATIRVAGKVLVLPKAGYLAQKLVRRTELSVTTKLSSGNETPPIANVLLPAALSSNVLLALSFPTP
jgi:hypothetical protein